MAFELKELQGSLFDNDRKVRDNQPDMTGSCKIGGTEYWVSAWVKQGRSEFLSLAFTEKDAPQQSQQATSRGGSFLSKKRAGNSARNEQRQQAQSKFEKEKAEFEAMTGKNGDFRTADDFDDDIPF